LRYKSEVAVAPDGTSVLNAALKLSAPPGPAGPVTCGFALAAGVT
jgi:hypothetical protein